MKSIRDIYKIGMGPSSSHTMGPAAAAELFKKEHPDADRYKVILYGSLSKTGKGHGTDKAVRSTLAPKETEVVFSDHDPEDMKHPNTMDLIAYSGDDEIDCMRVYSIGGGDIKVEGRSDVADSAQEEIYPENSFAEIKQFCEFRYIDLVEYITINEGEEIWDFLAEIWEAMKKSVKEGLAGDGVLPGAQSIQSGCSLEDLIYLERQSFCIISISIQIILRL